MHTLFEDVDDEQAAQWNERMAKVVRLNKRRRLAHAVKQAQRDELIRKARQILMTYNWPESALLAEFGARRLERLSDGVLMRVVGALILTSNWHD